MAKIKLSTALEIKGKEVKEVELDFASIKGSTLLEAEKEARLSGDQTPSVFLSMIYQAIVAAKIIGVPADDIKNLPANDFKKIVLPVANFLLDAE